MEKESKYQYDFLLDKEMVANENTSHTLILRQIKEGSRVLECGPGGGIMTRYMKEHLHCAVTILEIDKKAFKQSMKYADEGYCVNLERDDWMTKLERESFDYILYADVLEHLRDPEKVLKKMKGFLKQDGRVLLSVPNVAHGDIIMNLLRDQFTYLPLGLLDDTHIHLFAYENLHTMIKNAGYYLAYETCVTVPLFHSEQSRFISDGDKVAMSRALTSHPMRYAYQFICALSKEECETFSDVIARNQEMAEQDGLLSSLQKICYATCFFDVGGGYSHKNAETLRYNDSGRIELSFRVPANTRRIRFDPLEGHCCILRRLEIYSNQGIHQYKNLNGTSIDNLEIFYTTDPQIQILFSRPPAYLNIRADLILSEDPTLFSMMASCEATDRARELAEAEQQKLTEAMTTQRELAEAEQARLQGELSAASEAMTTQREEAEAEQARLQGELSAASEAMAIQREEAEAEQARLQDALASAEEDVARTNAENVSLTKSLTEATEMLNKTNAELLHYKTHYNDAIKQREQLKAQAVKTNADLAHYKTHYNDAIKQREQLKVQAAQWKNAYDVISNSSSWKATKPVRVTLDKIKRIKLFRAIKKGLRCWKENGFRYTCNKALDKLFPKRLLRLESKKELLANKEMAAQRDYVFPQKIKISIVVPLCNTREAYLRGMIESILNQTYTDWELCLADASDAVHQSVERICREYAEKDNRIIYRRLKMNYGEAGNVNAALRMAKGKYIGIMNHDDQLHPSALYEVMHAICDKNADVVYTDEDCFHVAIGDTNKPHFKPDFAPDSLRGCNYIGRFFVFSDRLFHKAGPVNHEYKYAWEYDLVLRLTERAESIVHIPKVLYYTHIRPEATALEKSNTSQASEETKLVLREHLRRVQLKGEVLDTDAANVYRIHYELKATPLISILIPNYEHIGDLKNCIDSIFKNTTYPNIEIIIIENNSSSSEIFSYYDSLQERYENVKVVKWNGFFNYAAICNYGARYCGGEYILLLNNDIQVLTPDWLQEMLMFAQRKDVGAVGTKLIYPDNTIQHGGVGIGIHGVADHIFRGADANSYGYKKRLMYAQNFSAVTGACMMIPKKVWDEVQGLDESFEVAFNDTDLCMRIRDKQYLIVWTPFAELYHFESKSRGVEDTPEKKQRFASEKERFKERWKKEMAAGDPYLNPNYDLSKDDYSAKNSRASVLAYVPKGNADEKQPIDYIRQSEYFDAHWYLSNNVDLQKAKVDPAKHYLNHGGFEMRDPSEEFCSEEYYNLHEDVRKARLNPLLHYEMHGKWENRAIFGFEENEISFPIDTVEAEREYGLAPVVHKRVAVLSCFFSDGFIPGTLFYLIRGLREAVDQIYLVGDCFIYPNELDKLDGLVTYALFTRHKQYDFGSYKRGLEYARNHGHLANTIASELIFINDSCYGPVFPFSESFDRMSRRPNDFWGFSDYQSFGRSHVSSFFAVFKRRIIDEKLLDQFLERVGGSYDRGRVIATLETEMTVFLENNGMHWEALAREKGKNLFNYPVTFLKKYRVPIVKKKAFSRKGQESQAEALEIIRENAPELADLIQYKPFTIKKHHFPTIEEHLESCKEVCRRIEKNVCGGKKIRVLFMVFNATFFPSRPLFSVMLRDNLFDPYIAIIPDKRWGRDNRIPGMQKCAETLKADGISEDRIIIPEQDELDRWPDVCDGVDIVCYNSPYNLSSYRYLPRYSMGRAFLPIMVNYGFYRSVYDDKLLSLKNYEYMWKAFFECEDTLAQYRRNSAIGGINGDIVGYIKMDPLSTVPCEEHERKRILVALHHSVEGGINDDLELGNMIRYSDYFLSLPDRYPEIDFVYRPHPHLFQVLILKNLWSEEKVEQYIAALKSKPNVIWSNGQDYFKEFAESDGCIQDCGSFLVEYFYTGKPCCYMLKDPTDIDKKFVELGKKCLEQCYVSYDTAAIDAFVENVILGENDEKAESRAALAKEIMVNYPHAAEAALDSIKKAIFEEAGDPDQGQGTKVDPDSATEAEQEMQTDSEQAEELTHEPEYVQKDEKERVQKNETSDTLSSRSSEERSTGSHSKKSKRNRRR